MVALSILVTRIAAVILAHTGLARETARFQARSAFSGVGFTTAESEKVVNHPVRRHVVLTLVLLGNAGIVTAVSSLILTFVGREPERSTLAIKIVVLVAGLAGLWALALSSWADRRLSRIVEWALCRYVVLGIDRAHAASAEEQERIERAEAARGDEGRAGPPRASRKRAPATGSAQDLQTRACHPEPGSPVIQEPRPYRAGPATGAPGTRLAAEERRIGPRRRTP